MRFQVLCLLTLLLVGCDPMAVRRVGLQLPPPPAESSVTLSLERPELIEALKIIDAVTTSSGMIETTKAGKADDVVQYYARPNPKGASIRCIVAIRGDTLAVVFSEFGRFTSSKTVVEMCALLQERFSSRYGAERVHSSGRSA